MLAQDGDGCIELPEQRGNHTGLGWGQASLGSSRGEQAWAAGQGKGDRQLALPL
jgi:hypothetical protein